MATNGNNLLIYFNGSVIGGTTASAERSNEINISCETLEVASPTSGVTNNGTWRVYIAGRKEWSVTVNYLVPTVSNITEVLRVGETYTLAVKNQSGTTIMSGTAICQQAKATSTRGNLIQGSFVFKGSGELSS